jgi:hypothetical protein
MEFFSNSNSHEARSSTPRSGGFQTADWSAWESAPPWFGRASKLRDAVEEIS